MISAKIVADSKSSVSGDRLTSFILTFPRIVLAEFNTHRMLSRNSASSRAIKFEKMLRAIQETPFVPIKWMKDHKGMQGYEFFTEEEAGPNGKNLLGKWLIARGHAIDCAMALSERGLTKQICNRLLEPFMYHTVIVTASEWENFFALRAHPDAEIHIQDLAFKMLVAYNDSTPAVLKPEQWHIPFGDDIDEYKLLALQSENLVDAAVKIATARCAGVSYTVVGEDGTPEDYAKLITRHDKLLTSGHMSPFEHCARVISQEEYDQYLPEGHPCKGWSGNFRGFVQYRKTIEGENKNDPRVRKQ